jgi:GR25 family glycosyltransferase involved in LPS biosynthesis
MMDWIYYFDRILCINLKRRTDRRERVEKEFQQHGLAPYVSWFDGIEREEGNIGCCLSHIYAWMECHNSLLVFEDDVTFHPKLHDIMSLSMRQIEQEPWDVFYLGYNPKCKSVVVPYKSWLTRVHGVWCTHAIAYSRTGIRKLLEGLYLFNARPLRDKQFKNNKQYAAFCDKYHLPIDMLIRTMSEAGELNAFACDPIVAAQYNSISDITHAPTRFDSWWAEDAKYETK